MQFNSSPFIAAPTTINPAIQGDRAARRFGIFFLSALLAVTIGAGVGIGVGNLAHYRYFSPNNQVNLTSNDVYNLTSYAVLLKMDAPVSLPLKMDTPVSLPLNMGAPVSLPLKMDAPVSLPVIRHVKKREPSRLWMSKEPSVIEDKEDHPR